MKRLGLLAVLLLAAVPAFGQNSSAQGWCEQGGTHLTVTSTVKSTGYAQISYPQCTVTVYLHNTLSPATIFSDDAIPPTMLGNPFTATNLGHWQFFAANAAYDVVLSGGGFPAPFTIRDVVIGAGGGGGPTGPVCSTTAALSTAITTVYNALPLSGGTIDCSNNGDSTLLIDPFVTMTKNVTMIMPLGKISTSTPLSIPSNVTYNQMQGGCLQNSAAAVFNGTVVAGPYQIFCGSVNPTLPTNNPQVDPKWFGAKADGMILGGPLSPLAGCTGTSGTPALTCSGGAFTFRDVGKVFDLAHAGTANCGQQYVGPPTQMTCNLVGTIASVGSATTLNLSVNLASSVSNEQFMYGTPDDLPIKAAINAGPSRVMFAGVFVIGTTDNSNSDFVVLNNKTLAAGSVGEGILLNIGPVAYDGHDSGMLWVDNGSRNATFQNLQFLGSNENGELTSFGPTHDGLKFCSGVPGAFGKCNGQSGIVGVTVINCVFSYLWGIGFHILGSGTVVGQRVTTFDVNNSQAQFDSYDGFNPNIYDGLSMTGNTGSNNGTGGIEAGVNGSMQLVANQFNNNRLLGIAIGGFNDNVTVMNACQVTANDVENNGNGYTVATQGVGLTLSNGSANCSVTGNTFRHNHLFGIEVVGNPQDKGYTISGNTINSNGIIGASQFTVGMLILTDNGLIVGNQITDDALVSISSIQRTTNVITVNTTTPNNYLVGFTVQVYGTSGAALDGTYTIASVVTGKQFTINSVGANSGPFTGFAYTQSFGFGQQLGLEFQSNNTNIAAIHNQIFNNTNANVYFNGVTNVNNITYAPDQPLQLAYTAPWGTFVDINAGVTVPSQTGVKIVMPPLPNSTTACTTAASAAATCTTTITHFLGNLTGQVSGKALTQCILDNDPVAQTGKPLIMQIQDTNENQATVVIGTLDGMAAGGGTLRCLTNFSY